jgi:hypothetical protein
MDFVVIVGSNNAITYKGKTKCQQLLIASFGKITKLKVGEMKHLSYSYINHKLKISR